MKDIEHNRAVRAVVGEREDGRFPITVTFELGNEVYDTVKDLDELEASTERWDVPSTPVFRQHAWFQLNE